MRLLARTSSQGLCRVLTANLCRPGRRVEAVEGDDLAGIHDVLRIERALDRAHGRERRCAVLGQQILRFVPGPYLQLARVVRQSGFESAADDILLRLEENRTNYSGLGWLGLLWRWIISAASMSS